MLNEPGLIVQIGLLIKEVLKFEQVEFPASSQVLNLFQE